MERGIVKNDFKGKIHVFLNSPIGAIFNHRGFEKQKPKVGTLVVGNSVSTDSGFVKVDNVPEGVNLGDSIIIYTQGEKLGKS
jgi:hypothetical protein